MYRVIFVGDYPAVLFQLNSQEEIMVDYIAQFLTYLEGRGNSPYTTLAYAGDLDRFKYFLVAVEAITENSPNWEAVPTQAVLDFVDWLRGDGYAEATVARRLAAAKSFYQYLLGMGWIKSNPLSSIPSVVVKRSPPVALTVEEVTKLLRQPRLGSSPEAKRDTAILETLYATGLRVTELVALDVNNVDVKKRQIHCPPPRQRDLPLHDQASQALSTYLNEARTVRVGRRKEAALFVNRRGERLTRQGFWLLLRSYGDTALPGKRVSPLTIRYSFGSHLAGSGCDIISVQKLLGHAQVSTTEFLFSSD